MYYIDLNGEVVANYNNEVEALAAFTLLHNTLPVGGRNAYGLHRNGKLWTCSEELWYSDADDGEEDW